MDSKVLGDLVVKEAVDSALSVREMSVISGGDEVVNRVRSNASIVTRDLEKAMVSSVILEEVNRVNRGELSAWMPWEGS